MDKPFSLARAKPASRPAAQFSCYFSTATSVYYNRPCFSWLRQPRYLARKANVQSTRSWSLRNLQPSPRAHTQMPSQFPSFPSRPGGGGRSCHQSGMEVWPELTSYHPYHPGSIKSQLRVEVSVLLVLVIVSELPAVTDDESSPTVPEAVVRDRKT